MSQIRYFISTPPILTEVLSGIPQYLLDSTLGNDITSFSIHRAYHPSIRPVPNAFEEVLLKKLTIIQKLTSQSFFSHGGNVFCKLTALI
jgi:hypothetical protein